MDSYVYMDSFVYMDSYVYSGTGISWGQNGTSALLELQGNSTYS